MNIGKRIQIEGPDFSLPWWKCSGGHGSDEYWNCSWYFRCILGGIVIFWDPHFQTDIEVPLYQPQEDEAGNWQRWFSAKFMKGEDLWQ